MFKKLTSMVLAGVMALSVMASVTAADINQSGGSGDSKVTLDINSRNLKVTVPSVLPIWVDSDNNVTVATNAKIQNRSEGPVDVTDVSVEADNNWSLVDFNTDFTKVPVDTKQYGMTMYNDDVIDGVDLSLFDRINGSDEIAVQYNGNVAIQSSNINKLDIGHVVFTVAWADGERLGVNDITYNVENGAVQAYLATPEYDSNDYSYTNWNSSFASDIATLPANGRLTVPSSTVRIVIKNSDGSVFLTDNVSDTTYLVSNLIPNETYSYETLDSSGTNLQSGAIYPTGQVRMLNVGSSVVNARDIGGWQADGGKLKYGKIYRGMELNGPSYGITLSDKSISCMTDVLNIKDEIDLRSSSELTGVSNSALGDDVSYVNYPAQMYDIARDIYTSSGANYYVQSLRRVISDLENNKPVYIHCVQGADRTATLCVLIEALCGVSEDSIDRDYELSSFFVDGKLRNEANMVHLKSLLRSSSDLSIFEGAVNWAVKAGMSISEINRLRALLINGDAAVLSDMYLSDEKFDVAAATLHSHPDWQSGELVDYSSNVVTTDFILCGPVGQIELSSDCNLKADSYSARVYLYDESKNLLGYSKQTSSGVVFSSDGKSVSIQLAKAVMNHNVRYIRVCSSYSDVSNVSVRIM